MYQEASLLNGKNSGFTQLLEKLQMEIPNIFSPNLSTDKVGALDTKAQQLFSELNVTGILFMSKFAFLF